MGKWRFGLFKSFSVPARLYSSGALALAGLIATSTAGYVGLTQSSTGLESAIMSTSAVLYQKDAEMVHDALRADVLLAMITGPDGAGSAKLAVRSALQEHITAFKQDINNLDRLKLDDDVKAAVASVRPLMDTYLNAATKLTTVALTDGEAAKTQLPAFLDAFGALKGQMGTLGEKIQTIGNTVGRTAREENFFLVNVMIASALTAGLILIVSNLLIARSITKPLQRVKLAIKKVASGNLDGEQAGSDRAAGLRDEVSEISEYLDMVRGRLRQAVDMEASLQVHHDQQQVVVTQLRIGLGNLSSGNLSQPITTPFDGEYEGLRTNFNVAVDRMSLTLNQIVQTSRSIRARVDDINTGAEDLSRRTENQAATLQETAAALDELTASIKSAATGAREVETIVQSARREAEGSGQVVKNAVEAMTGIERSSDQISQIIGVIDDIAFQTNLLALNAGVEAARAGEAGRGFAVVASEVRALAQRSSDASKEIKSLINSSAQFVGRGVDAVGGAGRALNLLVDRVSHISTLVSGIATGAAEQSTALAEVNAGVTQLDQVAQRNAAMVEQSSTATAALQDEAIGLDKLVSQFITQTDPAARTKKDRPMRAAA